MPAGDTVEIRELGDADYLITAAPLAAADTPPVTALLMRPTAEALLDYRELLGRFVALAALSALLAAGGAVLVARGVSRPIRGLAEAAQRIAAGDYAAELPLRGAGEVGRLAREFAAMQQAVGERETAIEYLAYHDDLTGLANRNRFRDEIARRISVTGGTAERRGRLAIVVLDLDRFREINDTLGHHIGDRLLLEIAGRLRREAAGGNLVAARLGGDEFGLLLAVEGVGDARRRIEELRHRLGEPSEVDDVRLDLEARFGIALHPDHGGDPATLLRQAEVAMYVAKERRLGVAFYDSSQDRHSIERLSLVGDLRRAIESESLELVFQPKLDLRSGRADEVEVLLRWHHPRRGALSPAEFVPIAEQTGLIRPLTAWVLERATAELAAWARGGDPLAAAVNLSALDLHDPELGRRILETLARHGVAPSLLTLEITESSVLEEPETARRILDQVTAAGVRVSIDDFGTGYSSLAQLKRLPVTELKIDRSFVAEMGRSPDVRQIVRSAIELGHNLGLEVVAEGVESDETLAALRDMGCDKAQGFGISEPLTAGELASWIAARAGGRAGVAS
jgi:diguanylate cyclase (GGDEF)-like protein